MGVCDMALEEVDRRLKSAGSEVSSDVTVRRSSSSATPDLWSGKRYYAFSPSDLSDRVVFETSPGGGAHATAAEYVLEMQIWGLQPAANERIVVSLRADVENDSTLIQRDTITADGPYRVALINPPGNYVRRIYGYLRVIAPSSKVYVDSLRLKRDTIRLRTGDTASVMARIFPYNASDKKLGWTTVGGARVLGTTDSVTRVIAAADADTSLLIVGALDESGKRDTCVIITRRSGGTARPPTTPHPTEETP